MESVVAEVLPLGNNAREPLPILAHKGTEYVIAAAGTEWELRVKILNAEKNQHYRVRLQYQQHCYTCMCCKRLSPDTQYMLIADYFLLVTCVFCTRCPPACFVMSCKAYVKLDCKSIGYNKTRMSEGCRRDCDMVFQGFPHKDPSNGSISYRAFKFGALKPAADAVEVDYLDQIQAAGLK
jgi:hypothetical protein